MSFFAYGYVRRIVEIEQFKSYLRELETRDGPRLREERVENLHNFPSALLPDLDTAVCFSIDDGPGRRGAEYLLDIRDYASDAAIGLPTRSSDRLRLLIQLLLDTVAVRGVARLAIALTDSDEIERVKFLSPADLRTEILGDISEYSPPNVLYVFDVTPGGSSAA